VLSKLTRSRIKNINPLCSYARTSTKDQNIGQQAELLEKTYPKVKAANVYQEQACGTTMDRVVLDSLLGTLQAGDEVIVYDMSRLNSPSPSV